MSLFIEDEMVTDQKTVRQKEEQLLYLLKNIPDFIITVDRHGTIDFINNSFIPGDRNDHVGNSIYQFVGDKHSGILEKSIARAFAYKEKSTFEIEIVPEDSQRKWYSVKVGPLLLDNCITHAMLLLEDISTTKRAQAALDQRLTFENMLSTISAYFVNISIDKIDIGINKALKLLAIYTKAPCAAVFLFNDFHTHMERSYLWCENTFNPLYKKSFQFHQDSYICNELSAGKLVKIEKPEDLPVPPSMMLFQDRDFQPILIVPMLYKGSLYGAISFINKPGTERLWEDRYTPLLQFFADILVNALLRKKKEKALRYNEARFRGVLDAAKHVGFIISDFNESNPVITEFSPGAELIFGYTRDEIIGKPVSVLHLPTDIKQFPGIMKRMKDGEIGFKGESVLVRKSGEYFSALFTTYPLFDEKGNIASVLGITIDITNRKEMEKALLDAEQEKALILSSVSELVVYMDPDMNIIWANKAACDASGISHEHIAGKKCFKIWHDGETVCGKCPVAKALSSRQPEEGEITTPDGRIWIIRAYPIRSQEGTNMGIVEVAREITHVKRIEEKLRLTQFSIDHAAIATFWTDHNARLVYVNDKACESLGYTREELLSMSVIDIDPHHTKEGWPAHWEKIREKRSFLVESEHKKKDGSLLPVEVLVNYLNFEGNEYNFAFARDITEKKKSAEEKSKLEEQLLQARKMEALGRLAGGVAHDFNNILTGMQGYVHFIKLSLEDSNPLQSDLNEIKFAIERAAGLTEQLLAFSKKQVVAPQVLNINALVDDAQNMLSRIIGEDIELIVCKKIKDAYIRFDAHQMDQVLVNLAVNARDAMPNGGKLSIETSHVVIHEPWPVFQGEIETGEYICLKVSDTGCGIDNSIKDHIFEPFITAHKQGKGAGLGLSTVYGIVNQHKGYINVISGESEGTAFEIYIPGIKECVAQEEEGTIEQFIHLPKGNETILLVEDEEMVRSFTKRFLSLQGYNVLEVSRPDEAGQLCITYDGDIDLLLTDVIMPEMNGRELYEKLKNVITGLKVLYMSGYSGDIIAQHGILDQDTNFIYKPFTIELLTEKIRHILDEQ
jgi:PAS domain S-box-containing protein